MESEDLGPDVHQRNATICGRAEADILACNQRRRCAGGHRPVHRDEICGSAEPLQQALWHRYECGMVGDNGVQHLFGDVRSAQQAESQAGPAGDAGLRLLNDG